VFVWATYCIRSTRTCGGRVAGRVARRGGWRILARLNGARMKTVSRGPRKGRGLNNGVRQGYDVVGLPRARYRARQGEVDDAKKNNCWQINRQGGAGQLPNRLYPCHLDALLTGTRTCSFGLNHSELNTGSLNYARGFVGDDPPRPFSQDTQLGTMGSQGGQQQKRRNSLLHQRYHAVTFHVVKYCERLKRLYSCFSTPHKVEPIKMQASVESP
jgi:hypothetical protein